MLSDTLADDTVLARLKNLVHLIFFKCPQITDTGIVGDIGRSPNLKKLRIDRANSTHTTFSYAVTIANNRQKQLLIYVEGEIMEEFKKCYENNNSFIRFKSVGDL